MSVVKFITKHLYTRMLHEMSFIQKEVVTHVRRMYEGRQLLARNSISGTFTVSGTHIGKYSNNFRLLLCNPKTIPRNYCCLATFSRQKRLNSKRFLEWVSFVVYCRTKMSRLNRAALVWLFKIPIKFPFSITLKGYCDRLYLINGPIS